jgi:hypothetical protein
MFSQNQAFKKYLARRDKVIKAEISAEAYKLKYEKLYWGLINSPKNSFKIKMKIFLLGLVIPIIAWLVVGIISAKPLFSNELITHLIKMLLIRT